MPARCSRRPGSPLAEWLVEEGIGETRALLVEGGRVLAARLRWPGEPVCGAVHAARLTRRFAGTRRGIATLDTGSEALIDHLPREATEGVAGKVRLTRAPIHERGRLKRAQARWLGDADPGGDPVGIEGEIVRRFPQGLWEDVWHAASAGAIAFAGGEILCAATPAMTVIDIDGELAPTALALAAVPAVATALAWFESGGNIGIDFPTIEARADRRAVDEALAAALDHWPHERTAMNGFGFVQIVARLEGPSLLHRFATSRTGMCARFALRQAERVEGAGVTLLTVHPAIKAKLRPEWLEDLCRRTGRAVRVETDPGLALEAPSAQVIPA